MENNNKGLSPAQIARRKYEEKNKEERKQASAQFSTFVPRPVLNEINEFLARIGTSKVHLIMAGFMALKEQYEPQDKKQ